MRRSFAISLCLVLSLFLFPWLHAAAPPEDAPPDSADSGDRGDKAPLLPPAGDARPQPGTDAGMVLRVKRGEGIEEMTMETYLRGVLRAEMPASFQQEALKAQAVAARTYILYKTAHGPIANHPEADACDDIHCCQAFKSEEDAAAGWEIGRAHV